MKDLNECRAVFGTGPETDMERDRLGWARGWIEKKQLDGGGAERGVVRETYGMGDPGHRRSFVDHVRVCSSDPQDVENPVSRGCERVHSRSICHRSDLMDVIRNPSPRFHHYWGQCRLAGYTDHRIRILCEAHSKGSTQGGMTKTSAVDIDPVLCPFRSYF